MTVAPAGGVSRRGPGLHAGAPAALRRAAATLAARPVVAVPNPPLATGVALDSRPVPAPILGTRARAATSADHAAKADRARRAVSVRDHGRIAAIRAPAIRAALAGGQPSPDVRVALDRSAQGASATERLMAERREPAGRYAQAISRGAALPATAISNVRCGAAESAVAVMTRPPGTRRSRRTMT
jgi:hypothetical protein